MFINQYFLSWTFLSVVQSREPLAPQLRTIWGGYSDVLLLYLFLTNKCSINYSQTTTTTTTSIHIYWKWIINFQLTILKETSDLIQTFGLFSSRTTRNYAVSNIWWIVLKNIINYSQLVIKFFVIIICEK